MKLHRPVLALVLAASLLVPATPVASAANARTRIPDAATRLDATQRNASASPLVANNELIVRLEGDVTAAKLSRIYRGADTSAGAVSVVTADVLTFEAPAGESLSDFADKLEGTGEVAYAEPNYIRQPAGYTPAIFTEPNDPAYKDTYTWGYYDTAGNWSVKYQNGKSWWIRDVKAIEAWRKGYTGASLAGRYPLRADGAAFKVAVIDTGMYTSHPDRSSASMLAGSAGRSSDINPVDPSLGPNQPAAPHVDSNTAYVSHGTCVAGIIGATVGNGTGTLGMANDTQVAMYKAYFGGSGIEDADIISALHRAADDGCKVINMSLAGGPYAQPLQDAINYAWGKGCVIVAATGNNGASTVSYPGAMDHVVAVGALGHGPREKSSPLDGARVRASFSNYGTKLDLSAPGSWIWGLTKPDYTDPDNGELGYRWWDGTSMASPIVAGSIALLWRAAPWMTNSQVVELVQSTADDLGSPGRDNVYGHGDVNLERAYNKLVSDYPLLKRPVINKSIPNNNARNIRIEWAAVPGYGVTYDIAIDGTGYKSGLTATSTVLPYDTTTGQHVVTVTARSPRNWTDGSETDSLTVRPSTSTPEVTSVRYYRGKLIWSTTEDSREHTATLSVDGTPVFVGAGSSWETTALSLSPATHTATLTVQDAGGVRSKPATLSFTVRPNPVVKRITATDRFKFATSVSASEFTTATTAVLVGSGSWMDALSAAPLAHVVGGPVLVTSRTKLPTVVNTELRRLRVKNIIIVGNTSDVSSALRASLKSKGYSVTRLTGDGRYETANAVARSIYARTGAIPDGKAIVVGDSFQYALAASAVAANKGWPLLYANSTSVPLSTRSTIKSIGVTSTVVVGGTTSVPDKVMAQLPAPERISASPLLSVPTLLARWATANYPATFSGERVYVANNSSWMHGLSVPAAAAHRGGLVLVTTSALAAPVRSYYLANSEVAVITRVVASTHGVTSTSLRAIKSIVGAP